ncbi:MAG: LamG-like jellyroll fold domain-containing protein [Thermoguttaceae bacterium]
MRRGIRFLKWAMRCEGRTSNQRQGTFGLSPYHRRLVCEALEVRRLLSQISGTLWNDLNDNGARDAGDPGLAGWTVYLDANGNGQLDPGEVSTTTAADGSYSFSNLPAGSYTVAEVTKPGWVETSPGTTAQPITADASTELLDHFDGSTLGYAVGPLNYAPSLTGLGEAASFGPGNYVVYRFPSWYYTGYANPPGQTSDPQTQGTVEMWVNPTSYGSLLDFNWNYQTSNPPAGHVLSTFLDDQGHFNASVWNFDWSDSLPHSLTGNMVVPLNQWTFLAFSWSPTVSKLYVNGQVDASVDTNVYPAIGFESGPVYSYLNDWGSQGFSGLIDEYDVSTVQRTDAEVEQDAQLTPSPNMITVAAGQQCADIDFGDYQINPQTPTVTGISSPQPAGVYGAGTTIPIAVTFSEPVNVSGTPQLTLNDGAVANYTGGSGTSTLSFSYVVAAGQNTSDLDYASIDALSPCGGSIQDAAGNEALLTLPPLGTDGLATQNIVIDGATLIVPATDWSSKGLTLTLGDDGNLHVYTTGTTSPELVPPCPPASLTNIEVISPSGTTANLTVDSTGDPIPTGGLTYSGGGGLIIIGSGSATLSGMNSYTGGTTVSSGTLLVNADGALSGGGSLTVGAGANGIFGASQAAANPSPIGLIVPVSNTATGSESFTPIVAASALAKAPVTASVVSIPSPAMAAPGNSAETPQSFATWATTTPSDTTARVLALTALSSTNGASVVTHN